MSISLHVYAASEHNAYVAFVYKTCDHCISFRSMVYYI